MVKLNKEKQLRKKQTVKHTQLKKRRVIVPLALAIVAATAYVFAYQYTHNAKVIKELQNTQQELQLKKELIQTKEVDAAEKQRQIEELNIKLQEAQQQLQARKQAAVARAQSVGAPGNCAEWMVQAGIPITAATSKLILNESGCRTWAVNPKSGACGIPQAWPCSKLPCPLDDSGAVCQLQWMDNYVKNRYGTWENALSMWYSRCGSPEGCWY